MDSFRNLACQERWDRVPHLNILLGAGTFKEIVVRKSLKTSGLSNRERPALGGVRVDKVVAVF